MGVELVLLVMNIPQEGGLITRRHNEVRDTYSWCLCVCAQFSVGKLHYLLCTKIFLTLIELLNYKSLDCVRVIKFDMLI